MINERMGAQLWRRYYTACVNTDVEVRMLPQTLKALLEQAGIPEPEDDVVRGPGGHWRGRMMKTVAD